MKDLDEIILKKKSKTSKLLKNQVTMTVFTILMVSIILLSSSYAYFDSTSESKDVVNLSIKNLSTTNEVIIEDNKGSFKIMNDSGKNIEYFEININTKKDSSSIANLNDIDYDLTINGNTFKDNLGKYKGLIYSGKLDDNQSILFDIEFKLKNSDKNTNFDGTLEIITYNSIPDSDYIVYDLNGSEDFVIKTNNIVSTKTPIFTNHSFLGWSDSLDGEPKYYPGDSVDRNGVLYAVWNNDSSLDTVKNLGLESIIGSREECGEPGFANIRNDQAKLCVTKDNYGDSYYYLSSKDYGINFTLGDLSFRLLRVNGDGSIRLVSNSIIGHSNYSNFKYNKSVDFKTGNSTYNNYSIKESSLTTIDLGSSRLTLTMNEKVEYNDSFLIYGDSYSISNDGIIVLNAIDKVNIDTGINLTNMYAFIVGSDTQLSSTLSVNSPFIKIISNENGIIKCQFIEVNANNYQEAINSIHNPDINSTILDKLYSWYSQELERYDSIIKDNVFCNDRETSIIKANNKKLFGYNGNTFIKYYLKEENSRIGFDSTIYNFTSRSANNDYKLTCNYEDSFTLNWYGNKGLEKSIGLLTADEIKYSTFKVDDAYYSTIDNLQDFWTMTPAIYDGDEYGNIYYYSDQQLKNDKNVTESLGIRPVISIDTTKADISCDNNNCTINIKETTE